MATTPLADPEAVAVVWARGQEDLAALVEGRVSTRLPSSDRIEFPWLRVFTVGSVTPPREFPTATALLQWEAFAATGEDDKLTPDYETASLVARMLAAVVSQFDGANGNRRVVVADGEEAIVDGLQVVYGPAREDDEFDRARYRVDTIIYIRNG